MNDLMQYLTTGTEEFVMGWDWVGDCVHGVGDWCWVHCVGWCCYNIDLNMFQCINIIILMNTRNMNIHYTGNSTDVDSHSNLWCTVYYVSSFLIVTYTSSWVTYPQLE